MQDWQSRFDAYCEGKELTPEQVLQEKSFNKCIFMGAGNDKDARRDWTGQMMAVLFFKLYSAMSIISGMQQNGGMGHPFDHESQRKDDATVRLIAEDIWMALMDEPVTSVNADK